MKTSCRDFYIKQHLRLTQEEKVRYSRMICSQLFQKFPTETQKNILLYAPFSPEVDIQPYLEECLRHQRTTFIPVVTSDPVMALYSIHSIDTFLQLQQLMQKSKSPFYQKEILSSKDISPFSIWKEVYQPTLCIVPSVAVDKQGNRLGYGKGHYDRFLDVLKKEFPECLFVAPQFESCTAQSLPTDPWDIPMDYIVTEATLVHTKNTGTLGAS